MANCINYNAQHPGFKNKMDAAIRKQMLKASNLISQEVSDSDLPGWKFRVEMVRYSKKHRRRYASTAYVKFDDNHNAVLTITSDLAIMNTEQLNMYYR